ncbi:hypothetical protein GZ77_14675 [Endozoicomonas montiporae]|uniref:Outer membrane lipoprotein-sorting protein n=2 Tax=Endozoicomonas montiporae TaxID=1027273 RepID=A0A081N544_9GAMM|nr:hypothetical protein [Endozoicomonas montiporae]AMO57555.1 hypothetical protein EZMO1_3575 [Endozoicomonas montiporae CL-33]KEQ13567.1 hypothetical protein GZ77_14675 [Endozoicomonas montiporae]
MNAFIRSKIQFVLAPLLAVTLTAAIPAHSLPNTTTKRPIPLEQIISQMRKQHGNVVVYNARLIQEDRRTVRLIDFNSELKPGRHGMQRLVIDAFTGKEIELVTMRTPMPLEKTLGNLRKNHQIANITKTWMENEGGNEVRVIEFTDIRKKRWHARMDAYTGLLLDEHTFELKPSGKQVPLRDIISEARKTHKYMVILRTTSKNRKNVPVREIVYLNENGLRKRLIVDAITGETISDQLATNAFYQ